MGNRGVRPADDSRVKVCAIKIFIAYCFCSMLDRFGRRGKPRWQGLTLAPDARTRWADTNIFCSAPVHLAYCSTASMHFLKPNPRLLTDNDIAVLDKVRRVLRKEALRAARSAALSTVDRKPLHRIW
jgi:hypothetical protein